MFFKQLTCTLHTVLHMRTKATESMTCLHNLKKRGFLHYTSKNAHGAKISPVCEATKPFYQVIHFTYSYHSNPNGTGESSSTTTDP